MLHIICHIISLVFMCMFTFMSYIKRKYEAWWQKYTYVLSTGLNAGIAFSSIIIFFAVMYHEKILTGGVILLCIQVLTML